MMEISSLGTRRFAELTDELALALERAGDLRIESLGLLDFELSRVWH
jgi:hypothetical protein